MVAWVGDYFAWIEAFHVICVIAWMAGLFYLPRLFVYHTMTAAGSETSEMFKVMERRLLRAIMNPAMVASFVFGLPLLLNIDWNAWWVYVKLLFVLGLAGYHGFLAVCRRQFEADDNQRSERFYRVINEVPTVLMIVIVIMVIVKP